MAENWLRREDKAALGNEWGIRPREPAVSGTTVSIPSEIFTYLKCVKWN